MYQLTLLNLIEKEYFLPDSETEREDENFLMKYPTDSSKDALSEQQLLALRGQFKNELEHLKSEIISVSSKLIALKQETVEDFDIYIQDLKKAELRKDIHILEVKLKETQKVNYLFYDLVLIFRNLTNMIQL